MADRPTSRPIGWRADGRGRFRASIRAHHTALIRMETRATAATDDTTIAAIGNRRPGRWLGSWLRPISVFGAVWSSRTLGRSLRSVVRSIVMASLLPASPRDALFELVQSAVRLICGHESEELRGLAPSHIPVLRCPGSLTLFARGCTFAQDPRQCGTPSILGSASLGAGLTRFCRCASVARHVNASTGSSAIEPGDGRPSPR